MSNIGAPKDLSFLPEDVEQKLTDIQNLIVNLNRQKTDLSLVIADKSSVLDSLNKEIENANTELTRITSLYEGQNKAMDIRELLLNQKEEKLTIWATDLEKKEKQVNRYLAIFENMKNVIKSD